MSEKRWVHHKSGQGEKWEVYMALEDCWNIVRKDNQYHFNLPKSEYILCDPPEEWIDVTEHCEVGRFDHPFLGDMAKSIYIADLSNGRANVLLHQNYRLRKVSLYREHPDNEKNCIQWAFVVERRRS